MEEENKYILQGLLIITIITLVALGIALIISN